MSVERLGDLVGEGLHFGLVAFRMKIDPSVGQVLDVAGHVITTGQIEHLGTKTDPLDMPDVPDIAMGDMG